MKELTTGHLYREKKREWALTLLTPDITLENKITGPHLNRPGLALAGYMDRFAYDRVQVLGETEISYLQTVRDNTLFERITDIFHYAIPCVIITKGLSLPPMMERLAAEYNICLLSSRLATDRLIRLLISYLGRSFAQTTTFSGSFLEVFGTGLLITGKSGIGKSELALDLVERGHRLIADDQVAVRMQNDKLTGYRPAGSAPWQINLRGIGLVDIKHLHGSKAVCVKKRVDLLVELIQWKASLDKDMFVPTGNQISILGANIPIIYLPISPGKNVSVLIELIARKLLADKLPADKKVK